MLEAGKPGRGGGEGVGKQCQILSNLPLKDKMMADFSYFFLSYHLSVLLKFAKKIRFDGTANITKQKNVCKRHRKLRTKNVY